MSDKKEKTYPLNNGTLRNMCRNDQESNKPFKAWAKENQAVVLEKFEEKLEEFGMTAKAEKSLGV